MNKPAPIQIFIFAIFTIIGWLPLASTEAAHTNPKIINLEAGKIQTVLLPKVLPTQDLGVTCITTSTNTITRSSLSMRYFGRNALL